MSRPAVLNADGPGLSEAAEGGYILHHAIAFHGVHDEQREACQLAVEGTPQGHDPAGDASYRQLEQTEPEGGVVGRCCWEDVHRHPLFG